MIEWNDQGIVLGLKSFGEKNGLVYILTQNHGCHAGVVRGIKSKKNQFLQIGVVVTCQWKARLSEHLGSWSLEPEKSYLALFLSDSSKLQILSLSAQLTCQLLPERHPYPDFFNFWRMFLEKLSDIPSGAGSYVLFERYLLQELGFGLKLKSCAVTNSQENLGYVSPKTGCAVTRDVGAPYQDRLLALPEFLIKEQECSEKGEIIKGLDLTGHFLIKQFPEPKYKRLFEARQRFIESL